MESFSWLMDSDLEIRWKLGSHIDANNDIISERWKLEINCQFVLRNGDVHVWK